MLGGAEHPAAFLRASRCEDLAEPCVGVPEHLPAPQGSGSCSAPRSSFARSLVAPCPDQEATGTYEKSLPSYEQIQRQAVGSSPLPSAAQPRPRSRSQPAVQAKAEVHRELGGAGDPPREPAPWPDAAAGGWYVMSVGSGWHRWDAG